MSLLFNNKYRIPSTRLQNWNDSNEAMYFVKICTKNRENYFGEIFDSIIQPTEIGKIAYTEWYKTIELRPDMNLESGEFVVMPNHIHGIIEINRLRIQRTSPLDVSSNKIKTLSELMGAYKTTVSKQIHLKGYLGFAWQRSYYENIIRNEIAHCKISDYIVNNPARWNSDKFNMK